MPKKKGEQSLWLEDIEAHDYLAATSYLLLIYPPKRVSKLVAKLKKARITHFKAKDIFRASQLSLLGISNSHIEKDRKKIRSGEKLSPLLLVREENLSRVIVADGYHRLCTIYQFNEDACVPCKIV